MTFTGKAITLHDLGEGIVEMRFDLDGESVNKLNAATLQEMERAVGVLAAHAGLRGLLVTSGKAVFIVGADIMEFGEMFAQEEPAVARQVRDVNRMICQFEDLPVPIVVAINGMCLGGGFELALACDYRVMSTEARVGLPEVKLGLFPGFGGTVRLSRLIGLDNAAEWIATGQERKAEAALKDGAVDGVVAPARLREAALAALREAMSGRLDWRARRVDRQGTLKLNGPEQMMAFTTAMAVIGAKAGPNYPAPTLAIKNLQTSAGLERDPALDIEAKYFAKAAKTPQAEAMIGVFIADQAVKKSAAGWGRKAVREIKRVAVLGAGIMGGGIAYQAAARGTPVVMKDIRDEALALGMGEAGKLLARQVEKGRMSPVEMTSTLASIRPTLQYGELAGVDLVIEAVVEKADVKRAVFAEVEKLVGEDTIIASNTSTISIGGLAEGLTRPERFVGMHFFNPVHMMPLVEVIRGPRSSEAAVAATVAMAQRMGKTPIVVNDCPGFFVNRVLFPYFAGFHGLLRDGADFAMVDKVMERFGWPMGPAYLMDVVGMDTAVHAAGVMAHGFPDRMQPDYRTATEVLVEAGRLGQKSGAGYYAYTPDRKGKPKKAADPTVHGLLASVVGTATEFTPEQVVARCMVPLVNEVARCLEEGIVASPFEADIGLLFGIGFPPFRGGACRYFDQTGPQAFIDLADGLSGQGKLYEPPTLLREMAAAGRGFYTRQG